MFSHFAFYEKKPIINVGANPLDYATCTGTLYVQDEKAIWAACYALIQLLKISYPLIHICWFLVETFPKYIYSFLVVEFVN